MNKSSPIPHYLIESFLAAVEEPTLQKAGERLGLTQSALSRQMKLFEGSLPHRVFTFEGRKKVLTKYGKTLHDLLAPRFSQTQGLIDQASLLFSEAKKAHVKICGRGELLDTVAAHLQFQGQVSFLAMDSSQAMQAVLHRQCDIGIVYSSSNSSELVLKKFFSNRLRIVIPKTLLKNRPTSSADLVGKIQKIPCFLYKQDDPTVEEFLNQYHLNLKELNISRIYANYASLIKMINSNQGWGVLPSSLKIPEKQYHIYELSGVSRDERTFYLCFRRELKNATWFNELISEFVKMVPRSSKPESQNLHAPRSRL